MVTEWVTFNEYYLCYVSLSNCGNGIFLDNCQETKVEEQGYPLRGVWYWANLVNNQISHEQNTRLLSTDLTNQKLRRQGWNFFTPRIRITVKPSNPQLWNTNAIIMEARFNFGASSANVPQSALNYGTG